MNTLLVSIVLIATLAIGSSRGCSEDCSEESTQESSEECSEESSERTSHLIVEISDKKKEFFFGGGFRFYAKQSSFVTVKPIGDCISVDLSCTFSMPPGSPCGANMLYLSTEDAFFQKGMKISHTSNFHFIYHVFYLKLDTSDNSIGGTFQCFAECAAKEGQTIDQVREEQQDGKDEDKTGAEKFAEKIKNFFSH